MHPDLYPMHTKGGLWLPNQKPLYSPKLYVDDERCVFCLLFNEAGGNIAHDVSVYGHHGVLINGPSWTTGNFRGPALDLDGGNDHIDLGDKDIFSFTDGLGNDKPFSMSIWFYAREGSGRLIDKYAISGNNREWIFDVTINDLRFFVMNNNSLGNRIGRQRTANLVQNQPYHAVATYDGSKTEGGIKLYLDGERVDNVSASAGNYTGMSNGTDPVTIGADTGGGTAFNSIIDGVRLYDIDLTQAEAQELYHNPFHDIKELRPMVFGFTGAAPVVYTPQVVMVV